MSQEVQAIREATVEFAGELDLAVVDDMRERLNEAFETEGVQRVVVDLAGAEFVDSTALGVLVSSRRRADEAGIGYTVVNVPTRVERLFAITGTLTLLTGREL